MNMEVEAKFRIEEKEAKKLLSILMENCRKTRIVRQRDEYYNHPCRDFSLTDEALRLRMESWKDKNKSFLTYKGPRVKGKYKGRMEITVEIPFSQTDLMKEILGRNGYRGVAIVDKERTYFDCGRVEVSLDKVSGLGTFLEIEAKKDAEDVIQDFIKRIGVRGILEEKTYLEMLLEKRKRG
jgi:adenylate cyclase class 2